MRATEVPMQPGYSLRPATPADAAAVREIYRPYVESTPISFELEVPSVEVMTQRIASALEKWSYLVAEADGEIAGYAYGSAHRPREAYRFSVEVSAYVSAGHQRKGIARALYLRLLRELDERGYHNAYAGITVPNAASVGFHSSLGFETIGVFGEVGWKFERWHDVAWMSRPVRSAG